MRTFRQRISPATVIVTVITALLALSFLWNRSAAGAVIALALMLLTVVLVDRILHSEYVFLDDSLTVRRGRFARPVVIAIKDITEVRTVRTLFTSYILVVYASGRYITARPDNTGAFIDEIKRRKKMKNEE